MDQQLFESRLQSALQRVKVVLEAAKAPCFPSNAHHQYQDKYLLAECMTAAAAASQVNCLAAMGLSQDQLRQLRSWGQKSAVSLRFSSTETCKFDRKETREVEDPTKHVTEASVGGVVRAAITSKVVTTVTEYFWKFESSYELTAVRGIGQEPADRLKVLSRTGVVELKTGSDIAPYPAATPSTFEVNVSWLVRHLEVETLAPTFQIDRSHPKCRTPLRNPDVDAACEHFASLRGWLASVAGHLTGLLRVQPDPTMKFDLSATSADALFIPVLPLLEDKEGGHSAPSAAAAAAADTEAAPAAQEGVLACLAPTEGPAGSVVLGVTDTNRLLAEEMRALHEKRGALEAAFPTSDAVATAAEAMLVATLKHCMGVCSRWKEAVEYVESLIRKQVIAAIGKEVSPADFAEYMRFHNRKLFADPFVPAPFCFAVRRSEHHSPEGTLSIEEEVVGAGGDSNVAAPVATIVARAVRPHRMHFKLSASTSVAFDGDRYLHAWLQHRFSGQSGARLSLVAKSRQFSSFLVLVGRIASANAFEPKYAAIVQNKDELTIPLDLSTIPTPKEFKDAIESLSPEQQAFCKAFRSMQLESTLFGVLVIQIKPQLEKVLNLTPDSLTKEIKLTQELMQLFIKYQISSDLLSYDAATAEGAEILGGASASERLEAVRGHVKAMHEMIEQAKKEEVEERTLEARYQQPLVQPHALSVDLLDTASCDSSVISRGGSVCDEAMMLPPDGSGCAPSLAERLMETARSFAGSRSRGAAVLESLAPQPAMYCSAARVAAPAVAAPVARSAPLAASVGSAVPVVPPPQAPARVPAQQQPQQPQQQPQQQRPDHGESEEAEAEQRDYTKVPKEMDARFEKLDVDAALRPTVIKPGEVWTKRAQKALLAKPTTASLHSDDQKKEKDAAFDLLDALTKSGALPVEHASLHVVVAATHCFDKTVTETVVQDNVNPIDKVERSALIMAGTVHQLPPAALVREAQLPRVSAASPALFLEDAQA